MDAPITEDAFGDAPNGPFGGAGPPTTRGSTGMMDGDDFERDFRAFCARPENAPALAEHQRQELRKMDRIQHRCDAMEFRHAVLSADEEAQRNVAPFLKNRTLRTFVSTFRNDPSGDFSQWACNPEVLRMLTAMQTAMEDGTMREEDVERLMVNYLRDPKNDGHEEFTRRTKREARLETKDLVNALNEQCQLRYEGNQHYSRKEFAEARECYVRALSIMNLVKGRTDADAAECDKNRLACLMNLGAACMAMKLYGEAVNHLNDALELSPDNPRVLRRRGRAHRGRGDFKDAKKDFVACVRLDPFDIDAHRELDELSLEAARDRRRVRALSRHMFTAERA